MYRDFIIWMESGKAFVTLKEMDKYFNMQRARVRLIW